MQISVDVLCLARRNTEELVADLLIIYHSLHKCGDGILAEGRLKDLLRRAYCFGLSLTRLDIRQVWCGDSGVGRSLAHPHAHLRHPRGGVVHRTTISKPESNGSTLHTPIDTDASPNPKIPRSQTLNPKPQTLDLHPQNPKS